MAEDRYSNRLLKPNTQSLSWFYGEFKNGSLVLDAKYQRNPIWSAGQKCFLIDSLISVCPVPQVFINIITKGSGPSRSTTYEVVDGQQRLRAILEFMSDEWELQATAAKAYPVSDQYKPYIGKLYSELPEDVQARIWDYPLPVQELRGWTEPEDAGLFRRLNYVVERLNKQEMRHSQYFGRFAAAVEQLAGESFWDDMVFFTRRDSQRMKDVEFVAELLIVVMDDVQHQQRSIDDFYAKYDLEFPQESEHKATFRRTLRSLSTIRDTLLETRLCKKADFYALFAATVAFNAARGKRFDLRPAAASLENLDRRLQKKPEKLRGDAALYHSTVIEGPNKQAKRRLRASILAGLIAKACGADNPLADNGGREA